jgi:hypothetical protein
MRVFLKNHLLFSIRNIIILTCKTGFLLKTIKLLPGIKIPVFFCVLLTQINHAEDLSEPLKLAIENCSESVSKEERFACSLMMHDMLCYTSVMQTALSLTDDRRHCLSDQENPIFKQYLKEALQEMNKEEPKKKQLQTAYQQWQYNITNLPPQNLEPEYQFKLRRETNSQQLLLKLIPIQQRHINN